MRTDSVARWELLPLVIFGALLLPEAASAQEGRTPVRVPALEQVAELLAQKKPAAADSVAQAHLRATLMSTDSDSASVATALEAAVKVKFTAGGAGDPRVLGWAQRAVAIREQSGSEAELGKALSLLGQLYRTVGNWNEAEPTTQRALETRERAHGVDSLEAAEEHNGLGAIHLNQGKIEAARRDFERVLAIRQQRLDPNHADIGSCYHNIAVTYLYQDDAETAEPLLRKAMEIREKALGVEHPHYAMTVGVLASLAHDRGDDEEAIRLYQQVLDVYASVYGPEHPSSAAIWTSMALCFSALERYGEARRSMERSIALLEAAYGSGHSELAYPLDGLADVLYIQGDTEQAIAASERAAAIVEESFGPDHPLLAVVWTDLAEYHRDLGEFVEARALLARARANYAAQSGDVREDIAHVDQYLADILCDEGRHAEALASYTDAYEAWSAALGADSPLAATALRGIGRCQFALGNYAQAESTLQRVVTVREQTLGSAHQYVASAHYDLARLYERVGDRRRALDEAILSESIGRAQLRRSIRDLAEQPGLRYAQDREASAGLNLVCSILVAEDPSQEDLRRAWNLGIDARAFVLDEMALRRRALREMQDPAIHALRREWGDATRELTESSLGETTASEVQANQVRVLELEDQLAAASASFQQQRDRVAIRLADVEAAMPRNSALLAYTRFEDLSSETSHFAACVRAPNGVLRFVNLGPASLIDEAAGKWRSAIQSAVQSPSPNEYATRKLGAHLSQLIWEPLRAHLDAAEQIFIVPDGELALLNFAALPVGTDQYLIEQPALLHLISAERDLVLRSQDAPRADIQWLAMANPAFDRAETSADASTRVAFRGERSDCADFQSIRFQPLPVSAQEIADVRKLWSKSASTQLLVGDAASEANFKQLAPKAEALHLATHGFFLGGDPGLGSTALRGVGGMRPSAAAPDCRELNPLLLSGLALAGANARADREANAEDGVLTAEEIAVLDLAHTQWAVLSACETGVGDIRVGEGVMGLRRAFQVAGARTVIMSLWSVEEDFARHWMTALYRGRLRQHASTAEAVRAATLDSLERARRADNAHPFYWAAFVASGDWR